MSLIKTCAELKSPVYGKYVINTFVLFSVNINQVLNGKKVFMVADDYVDLIVTFSPSPVRILEASSLSRFVNKFRLVFFDAAGNVLYKKIVSDPDK